MIYGIGTDLVALDRVEGLLARYGERFVERVLMPAERAAYARSPRPVNFLGQRFAAKEACSKAFGLGLRYPATLQQMGVASDPRGKPLLVFGEALAEHAARDEEGGLPAQPKACALSTDAQAIGGTRRDLAGFTGRGDDA